MSDVDVLHIILTIMLKSLLMCCCVFHQSHFIMSSCWQMISVDMMSRDGLHLTSFVLYHYLHMLDSGASVREYWKV